MTATDPIDTYLNELLPALRGPAGAVRNTLAEAEAHLRDASDAAIVRGVDPEAAQRQAIASFGSVREVSSAANRGILGVSAAQLSGALVGAASRMVVVGLGAIAVAAVAARALAAITSTHFVYGTPPGATLSTAQCRHWLELHSGATTCTSAATLENAHDTFWLYLGGSVIGILVFAVTLLVARRMRRGTLRVAVPAGIAPAVGATIFGASGVALVGAGLSNAMVAGLWGRGLWYVEGVVALVVAVGYTFGFGRALLATTR